MTRIEETDALLRRIETALRRAGDVLAEFSPSRVRTYDKGAAGPVTDADRAAAHALAEALPRDGEGWLCEETTDDASRLGRRDVWIVDPLDGTREYLEGLPEWCVSVGFVRDGRPVAGGVLNPATGELVLGALGAGVRYNGAPAGVSGAKRLDGALVLASRSEVARGEWDALRAAGLRVRAMGSVAYKLALVAAGRADATWTLVPKNEWDIAAGAALVVAAGGTVSCPSRPLPALNRPDPLLEGLLAAPYELERRIRSRLALPVDLYERR